MVVDHVLEMMELTNQISTLAIHFRNTQATNPQNLYDIFSSTPSIFLPENLKIKKKTFTLKIYWINQAFVELKNKNNHDNNKWTFDSQKILLNFLTTRK